MKSRRSILGLAIALLAAISSFPAAAQILYKIEKSGLKPSYIFGTHHMAPLSILDSIPAVQSALDETEAVVGELDMTGGQSQIALAMMKYAQAPADSTFSRLLTPEKFVEVNDALASLLGMPDSLVGFNQMRPMVVTALVTLAITRNTLPGYTEGEQLDSYFQQEAVAFDKPVIGLETPDRQAQLLYTSMPIDAQLRSLLELISRPEAGVEGLAELYQAYRAGDLDKLLVLSNEEGATPEERAFMKQLLDQRNADWLKLLPGILAERPVFIAVGAAHLPGPGGLLQGLRDAGFTVTPEN